jgi:hypothetical protein
MDLLERGQVDGLLIASGILSDSFLKNEVLNHHDSVVMINRKVKGASASVIVKDELGAELAVEHLSQSGTKTIVGIFGPQNIDTAQRRKKGFETAAEKFGIKHQSIEAASWGMEEGRKIGVELLMFLWLINPLVKNPRIKFQVSISYDLSNYPNRPDNGIFKIEFICDEDNSENSVDTNKYPILVGYLVNKIEDIIKNKLTEPEFNKQNWDKMNEYHMTSGCFKKLLEEYFKEIMVIEQKT